MSSRFEEQAEKVREIQCCAGWSEQSTAMYLEELKKNYCDENGELPYGVSIGAGLAQDNSRFGVYKD